RWPLTCLQAGLGSLDPLDADPVAVVEQVAADGLDRAVVNGRAAARRAVDRARPDAPVRPGGPATARPGAPLRAAQDHERPGSLSARHLHHCWISDSLPENLSKVSTSGGAAGTDRGTSGDGTRADAAIRGVRAAVRAPTHGDP